MFVALWLVTLILMSTLVLGMQTKSPPALSDPPAAHAAEPLNLLPTAMLATADAAVAYLPEIASGTLRAVSPQVRRVQLITLSNAFDASASLDIDFPGLEPTAAVWRVEFGGARFAVPSCPPPDPEAGERAPSDYPCGYGDRAIIAVFAETGRLVNLTIPVPIHEQ